MHSKGARLVSGFSNPVSKHNKRLIASYGCGLKLGLKK
jgi:hypothetical protein